MTRSKIHSTARKEPRQSRSRATVNVILEAAIRVLEQEGPDAATTSRIADVAGVSVGTLYQYFANRDAILNALQDREFERAMSMMQRVLQDPAASSRDVARSVVVHLLELYHAAPALHRMLAVEALRLTPTERVQAFDMRMVLVIRSFLGARARRVMPKHPDTAAFVIYQSVRAAMLAYLLEQPPGTTDAMLIDELTDLIVRYLSAEDPEGNERDP